MPASPLTAHSTVVLFRRGIGLRLFVAGLTTLSLALFALGAAGQSLSGDAQVQEWPLPEVPEPSGVAYHHVRKTLFVVGDEGHAAEVSLDGRVIAVRRIGGDLEGVVCDPVSGAVYVVREGADIVLEISPEGLRLAHEITVDRAYKSDKNFLRAGGDGIEGITLKPAVDGKSEPSVFAVNQYDPPLLLELAMPARSGPYRQTATIRNAWPIDSSPLSDVSWDPVAKAFLIVSALWRNVHVVTPAGEDLRAVRLPGFMQEGIARLPDGSFVITQDTGGLLRWRPPSDPFGRHEDRAGAGLTGAVSAKKHD
jgi:hypothetical protein